MNFIIKMERSKIPMLGRFDTISHIMPFYAHTHNVFLLLSSLCSNSRSKLDEYYSEIIYSMSGNWSKINKDWRTDYLFLPSDLFIKNIFIENDYDFKWFIQFIENLKESQGWYFSSHFMHSQIKTYGSVNIKTLLFKKLHPYYDIFKTTHVRMSDDLSLPISLDTIFKYSIDKLCFSKFKR